MESGRSEGWKGYHFRFRPIPLSLHPLELQKRGRFLIADELTQRSVEGNRCPGNDFRFHFGTQSSANGKVEDTRNAGVTFVTGVRLKRATV